MMKSVGTCVSLLRNLIIVLVVGAALQVHAAAFQDDFIPIGEEYGQTGGKYIFDVPLEHQEDSKEIFLVQEPTDFMKPTLHELIFNPTLTNEFFFEYQQRFGWTEQEQHYYLTSRQGYYRSSTGQLTNTTEDVERRKFAEYMMRRLAEYHVDNYLKTEPSMKRVYEIKQAISNVKVQVGRNFKCDVSYNYSGNWAQATCQNPVADAIAKVQMDPAKFLPTDPNEVTVGLERPVTQTLTAEAHYTLYEGGLKGVLTKMISPTFSMDLTGITYLKKDRVVTDKAYNPNQLTVTEGTLQKENLVLLGAKVVF